MKTSCQISLSVEKLANSFFFYIFIPFKRHLEQKCMLNVIDIATPGLEVFFLNFKYFFCKLNIYFVKTVFN